MALSLSLRVGAPRMALDHGGAAIAVQQLDVWAGSSNLIEPFDWRIMPGERWSLVGPNGCGKSTLLKTIARAATETNRGELSNQVAVNPRLRFGMLEQTAVSGSERSVKDEVMSRMGAYQAAKSALEAAEEACVTGSEAELLALERAQSDFEAAGGYTAEKAVSLVLSGLGFSRDEFGRPCSSFSGGWQMRIGLARLLLSEPEILVLDEPTNHLDASARAWLGAYVGSYAGTVLLVSHDEAFVSAASESIADVDGGRLQLYQGTPYGRYRAVREARRKEAEGTLAKLRAEETRLRAVIDKWENVDRSKAAAAYKGLEKLAPQIEQADALLVRRRKPPRLTLAPPPACGKLPLALRGASVGHAGAPPVVRGVELEVARGRRLLLRGPNGAGKSTLLKALAGRLPLASGERLVDDRLELGVFAQDLAQDLPQEEVALSYVERRARVATPSLSSDACRSAMAALGLVGEKPTRPIGSLSGGEKARVALATFCLTPYNVLLLDEPTNHLDAEAIAALLTALDDYDGAVVVVSHDRPFCEAMRASHVGYVCDGACVVEERPLRDSDFSQADRGVTNQGGDTDDAAHAAHAAHTDGLGAVVPALSAEEAKAARQAERAAQKVESGAPRKLAKIEERLAAAEAALAELDDEMLAAGADVGRLAELSEAREAAQAKVEGCYAEMEALEAARADAAAALERALNFGLSRPPAAPAPAADKQAADEQAAARERAEARRKVDALNAAAANDKRAKKRKVGKRERLEYETIEADVDALESAAAAAEAALAEANAAKSRRPQMELLALASAAADARRAADEKMHRFLELEEMLAGD